jgi:hypothetical protein
MRAGSLRSRRCAQNRERTEEFRRDRRPRVGVAVEGGKGERVSRPVSAMPADDERAWRPVLHGECREDGG